MCFSVQVDRKLNRVASKFGAKVLENEFKKFLTLQKNDPKKYKSPDSNDRIYPKYYAPIITIKNETKVLQPMRYQLLPSFCEKNKYTTKNPKTGRLKEITTFNARVDSLEKRKAWSPLFMKKHCIVPIKKFYEWVSFEGKTKEISFFPEGIEQMWAPGLYDEWHAKDGKESIKSFAIITTNPPAEIEKMGHDRCPIFLKEEYIEDWLNPENESKEEVYEMLEQTTQTNYLFEWV